MEELQIQFDTLIQNMNSEFKRKLAERDKIEREIEALTQKKNDIMKIVATYPEKIKLDVGGKKFATRLTNLMKEESFFSGMFSGMFHVEPDEDGHFFIDRDPRVFRHIMNYFRGDFGAKQLMKLDDYDLEILKEDAYFYQIQGLISLIEPGVIIHNEFNYNPGLLDHFTFMKMADKIKVTSSSNRGDEEKILSRKEQVFQLMSVGSFVQWDFSEIGTIELSGYTIRHRGDRDKYALRNWKLEGSDDGNTWDIISRHDNDESIGEQPLSIGSWATHNQQEYKMLKLTSTGLDSTGCAFLNFSNIEFYGCFEPVEMNDDEQL